MDEGGEFPAGSRGERHEQLTAIAYLAAKTSRLKFLTSVMVVPHRPAVLTAKILATIDVMSGGRLIVGVGAGWLEEEFVAIGAPPFAERGTATDEYLMGFRQLWTKDKGDRFQFRCAHCRRHATVPRGGRRQIVSEERVHLLACNWRLQRLFAFELRRWEAIEAKRQSVPRLHEILRPRAKLGRADET